MTATSTQTPLRLTLALVVLSQLGVMAHAQGDAKKGYNAFAAHHCIDCHPGGSNIINPRRPLKGPAFQARYPTDAALADHIRKGSPGTAMPPFGKDELPDAQMVHLVAYLRSLTPAGKKPPAATKTSSTITTTKISTTTTKTTIIRKVPAKSAKTR